MCVRKKEGKDIGKLKEFLQLLTQGTKQEKCYNRSWKQVNEPCKFQERA